MSIDRYLRALYTLQQALQSPLGTICSPPVPFKYYSGVKWFTEPQCPIFLPMYVGILAIHFFAKNTRIQWKHVLTFTQDLKKVARMTILGGRNKFVALVKIFGREYFCCKACCSYSTRCYNIILLVQRRQVQRLLLVVFPQFECATFFSQKCLN